MSRGCTDDDVIVAGRAVRRSSYSAANQVPSKDQRQENFQGVPVDGNKASYRFAGIRKLIEVQVDSDKTNRKLDSGVELTYSVLVVDSLAEVEQLARGEMAPVLYRE